jgi:hypothetical protein
MSRALVPPGGLPSIGAWGTVAVRLAIAVKAAIVPTARGKPVFSTGTNSFATCISTNGI